MIEIQSSDGSRRALGDVPGNGRQYPHRSPARIAPDATPEKRRLINALLAALDESLTDFAQRLRVVTYAARGDLNAIVGMPGTEPRPQDYDRTAAEAAPHAVAELLSELARYALVAALHDLLLALLAEQAESADPVAPSARSVGPPGTAREHRARRRAAMAGRCTRPRGTRPWPASPVRSARNATTVVAEPERHVAAAAQSGSPLRELAHTVGSPAS